MKANYSVVHTCWWPGAIWCQNRSSHFDPNTYKQVAGERWREQVKRGGSDRVKYNILTLIGSHKQEQTSSTLPLGNYNCGWCHHLFNLQFHFSPSRHLQGGWRT